MLNLQEWEILWINAPSTNENKVSLPWSDPTSLYYALLPLSKARFDYNKNIDFNSEIFNPEVWNEDSRNLLIV